MQVAARCFSAPAPESIFGRGLALRLWLSAVKFEGHPQNTLSYVWGQETLRTIRCSNCGCATHWEAILPGAGAGVGVDINNFDQELVGTTPVRHFDGADSWAYLD